MSRLAILAAWVLPVVGAPALAQTIVTQGVSGNSFIAGQAVTYNSLSISPYLSPGMLLLTTTNAASATSPSLTVDAMAGTNFSGGASSQSIYIPLTGISVQAGGSQYQGGSSLPSWMNGPAVTVTNSATLAGYVQTATLPTGGAWAYGPSTNQIYTLGTLAAASFGANAWGNGSSNGWNGGGAGGTVSLTHSTGTLYVGPPGTGALASAGVPWQPYSSALAAFSSGGTGLQGQASVGNGGAGGAVNVTTNAGSIIQTYDNWAPARAYGTASFNGINALSLGGSNGWHCGDSKCTSYSFSTAGAGGNVTVQHNGSISSSGAFSSSLNAGVIGIAASSVGGSLACPNGNCNVTSSSGPQQPGGAGNVAVTLGSTGSITLQQGNPIGILATSATGSTPLNNYNGTQTAGNVSVSLSSGSTVTIGQTGGSSSAFSAGVLAVSAGNADTLSPFSSNIVATGGSSSSGSVTVNNAGSISTTGRALSVGIGALSVGGSGILTQAASSGVNYLGSTYSGSSSSSTASVSVTNSGSITTNGNSAYGIVALSGAAGGLLAAASNAVFSGSSVTSGVILGNSSGNTSGSSGGAVSVTNSGIIATGSSGSGNSAIGIVAQSIGGGGGSSGGQGAAAFVGDAGGAGGSGGAVTVNMTGGSLTTQNDGAIGVLAQSIGGGGGNGGNAAGLFVAVGGRGGSGGSGGGVSVNLSGGTLTSAGDFSAGVLAQSVGGGGGNGGYAKSAGLFISSAIGGAGGGGGAGGNVSYSQSSGTTVTTNGEGSAGVLAQSVGGGGGSGGAALTHSAGVIFSAAIALGGNGGSGGGGGAVSVTNSGNISATGPDSIGMLVQSIGGGGGNGGSALAKSLAIAADPTIPTISFSTAVGGTGGSGGAGAAVTAQNTAGAISTQGNGAIGILAQSIGGGGGTGADSTAGSNSVQGKSPTLNLAVSVGGSGSAASSGGDVIVMNAPYSYSLPSLANPSPNVPISNTFSSSATTLISTVGNNAPGIEAQSIGGGGGNGGAGNATAASPNLGGTPGTAVGLAYSMGGNGGGGGNGGTVLVSNLAFQAQNANGTAAISTTGSGSSGILAQSIGGGGGSGGGGAATAGGNLINLQVSVGGKGNVGGAGGTVTATNTGTITTGSVIANGYTNSSNQNVSVTTGGDSYGILAQSIGGGGGSGGSTDPAAGITALGTISNYLNNPGTTYVGTISVGGAAGPGSSGGAVTVNNGGAIATLGERAYGILAQSVGGGGGIAGGVATAANTVLGNINQPGKTYGATVAVGGSGGSGGDGGAVTVTNNFQASPSSVTQTNGFIGTAGYGATAVVAQSIGGGGGVGGEGSVNNVTNLSLGVSYTGSGGVAGSGGAVTVTNGSGTQIVTVGDDAYGVLAQSIGGGGGVGSAGCTNSASAGASGLSATQCLGNTNASASGGIVPWTDSSSFSVNLGGKSGASGSGGTVSVTENGSILTTGARSFGIAAQSIGGGGGIMTATATNLSNAVVQTQPGQNSAAGGNVSVSLGSAGSITTSGAGAWGIVAQSIGAGGGLVGDPSLPLATLVSNTLPTLYQSGADGGAISITSAGNISTTGVNAHGIVAQSIGGGGGIAAGYNQSTTSNVVMGNSGQLYSGLPSPTYSGQGGAITINQTGGTISASGLGSIGIIAQSSGNSTYMSPISITVGGKVIGGSGAGAAGILVSGGEATNNGHGFTPNTITVSSGGSINTQNGYLGNAIISNSGITNLYNYGAITGNIILGPNSASAGDAWNYGTWSGGATAVVANSTFNNYGEINPAGPGKIGTTTIIGGFNQTASGRLTVDIDSRAAQSADMLVVQGNAQVAGSIVPKAMALLPGSLQVLSVTGNLDYSATVSSSLAFTWDSQIVGNKVALTPTANFTPSGVSLTDNQSSLARYLARAWTSADPVLATLFGTLSQVQSAASYAAVLNASNPGVASTQAVNLARAGSSLLGSALGCPNFVRDGTLLGEDRCVWARVLGGQANQYAVADNPGYKVDGQTIRFGGQKQVAPGWYVGGALGAGNNLASASNFSSRGQIFDGSVSAQYLTGNWSFAGSVALAGGSFNNSRVFDGSIVPNAQVASSALTGYSSALQVGGRLRAAYEFALTDMYIRPYADLDLINTYSPSWQESGTGNLALAYASSNQTNVVISPMVEFGTRKDFEDGMTLRAFVDVGASFNSNDKWVQNASFVGANASNGNFQNTSSAVPVLGRVNVGVQLFAKDGWEVQATYGLQAGNNYLSQVGTARIAYHF